MLDLPFRVVNKLKTNKWRTTEAADNATYLKVVNQRNIRSFLSEAREPKLYGQLGELEVRLAISKSDVKRSQRLRYQIFYEEMNAVPSKSAMLSRRDVDAYDPICDHLLVVDTSAGPAKSARKWRGKPRVVGTYRLLRQDVAQHYGGFYTQGEYDINALIAAKGPDYKFVELGRSCVLQPYRNRRTLELLWHGIWSYVREHESHVMIGCASFSGNGSNDTCDCPELSSSFRIGTGRVAGEGS